MSVPVYSAGEWAHQGFGRRSSNMSEYVREITEWSLKRLREDFRAGLSFIQTHHDLSQPCIIEGERNPHDFVHLFQPAQDFAISLIHSQTPITRTTYELGLDVIWAYLAWLLENGLIEDKQHRRYSFDCLYISRKTKPEWLSLEEKIDEILANFLSDVGRDLQSIEIVSDPTLPGTSTTP